jgi:hypothetical protein
LAIRDQGPTAAHATETAGGHTFGALLRAHRLAANLTQATRPSGQPSAQAAFRTWSAD